MLSVPIWIEGSSRSGKTTRLVQEFQNWVNPSMDVPTSRLAPNTLVLAANDDNRRQLADQLASAVQGKYPILSKTPLGFFSDEITLFWPILFEILDLRAQFPLRLRPEAEQDLATQQWHEALESETFLGIGIRESRLVRSLLDLVQLAGASGIPLEDVSLILDQGFVIEDSNPWTTIGETVTELLLNWRHWCLQRGFLTYGLIYELYWRYLLPHPTYQKHLTHRYRAIFADDVDDYPAIARDLFAFLLNSGSVGVLTYNPDGAVRMGLNADPQALQSLATQCKVETLPDSGSSLAQLNPLFISAIQEPYSLRELPPIVQSIQEVSRAALLERTAKIIIQGIQDKKVAPQEIAVIAPGLDEIARYSLIKLLREQGIPVEPLNEQRSLNSSPLVRALLTLLGLVYPGLGRLLDRDAVAEMLVVLSPRQANGQPAIDPVRAGLLADFCYYPHVEHPHLLPVETFPRWDRLGHLTTSAYQKIRDWIEQQRNSYQPQQRFPVAIALLNIAIEEFLQQGSYLAYAELSALRELMETAQHYWEVNKRLQWDETQSSFVTPAVAQFIQLLRQGIITANAYPIYPFPPQPLQAITLATIYQYRALRRVHRWHFWLDASSHLWGSGGAATLYAAPLFLRAWSGKPWTSEDQLNADSQRLERIIRDLLARVEEQVFLCHSDLAVSGMEQNGPLLPLTYAARQVQQDSLKRSGG